MKPQKKLCLILAIGFIVLFFWCVGLYWGDVLCNRVTSEFLPFHIAMWDPPKELKVWTPTPHHSGTLSCFFGQDNFFANRQIGIVRFIQTLRQWPATAFLAIPTGTCRWIDFIYDDQTKRITVRQIEDRRDKQTQEIIGYIGPKGYSSTNNSALGTFEKPPITSNFTRTCENPNVISFFLYDTGRSRFYRIEMNAERKIITKSTYYTIAIDSLKIIEGPVQKQADWAPVQIDSRLYGVSDEEPYHGDLDITWNPPYKVIRQFRTAYADQYIGVDPNTMPDSEITNTKNIILENAPKKRLLKGELFVLHQNGRIDCLDSKTLSVVRCAGYLPEVGFYKTSVSRRPCDMADYEAFGFYDPNDVYLGTAVAAASRDGVLMAMDFYDAKANLSAHKSVDTDSHSSDKPITYLSGIQLVKDIPNGPFLLTIRYLLENLQPPALRLLDMPAASWIEPDERYCTLFVHPNSFVGLMKFEYDRLGFWWQLLFLMLPSLGISVLLGFKTRQKSMSMGFSELAIDGWFIAVLAFGIPAYITFKLMLPKERMVICANCGNSRRVEFEACQSCKRDWQKTKDLTTAPDWCVRDAAQHEKENSPAAS